METTTKPNCPRCQAPNPYGEGWHENNHKYHCQACGKHFQRLEERPPVQKERPPCPNCRSTNQNLSGKRGDRQGYRCKDCKRYWVENPKLIGAFTPRCSEGDYIGRNTPEAIEQRRQDRIRRVSAYNREQRVIAKEWAVKALTLELATEIKRQADLGTPHRAIAKEIGVKTQQIKTALKWLYHLDDPIPVKRERPKASKRNRPTTEERRHRLTMLSVRDQQLKDERDRWLAEDLTVEVATLIRNQVIMGKSARVIAEQLGIQIESVAQALGWLAQRNGQSERDRARKRKGIKDLKPAIGAISRQPGDKKFQHIFKGNQEKRRSSGRFPQIHIQPSIELLHFSNPRPVREYTDAEIDRRLSRSIGRVGF